MIQLDLHDAHFAMVFMLIALSSFLCPNSREICSSRYYSALVKIWNIKNLDWCSFILEWLVYYIEKYQKNRSIDSAGPSGGCGFILVVSYLEYLTCSEFKFPNDTPRLKYWSTTAIHTLTLLDCTYNESGIMNFGR
ncbi:hypothetical protein ACP70R_002458 [Stipagrostis hirtigluma subsp. patula]